MTGAPPPPSSLLERALGFAAHPVRALAWVTALGVALGPLGGATWVAGALVAVPVGLLLGERLGRGRLRLFVILVALATAWAASWLAGGALLRFSVFSAALGAGTCLAVATLLRLAATVTASLAALRALAYRGRTFDVIELASLSALLASAVAAHRDGAIARPLWLSDLAWSYGVDPGDVLHAGGVIATMALGGLLFLGSRHRKPLAMLAMLPVVALIVGMLARPDRADEPVQPEDLLGLDDEMGRTDAQEPGEDDGGDGASGAEPGEGGGAGGGGDEPGEQDGAGAEPGEGDGAAAGGQHEPRDAGASGGGSDASGASGGGDAGPGQPTGGATGQDEASGGAGATEGGELPPPDAGEGSERAPPVGGTGDDGDADGSSSKPDAPDPLDGGSGGGDAPVAVVLLDDDHSPPSQTWYLRQDVLTAFNGSRLLPPDVEGATDDLLEGFPIAERAVAFQPTLHRERVRGSVTLIAPHPKPFAPEAPIAFAPRANPDPARFDRSYHFASNMLTATFSDLALLPVGDPAWSPELREHYLTAPADPRYAELNETILAQLRAEIGEQLPADAPIPPVIAAAAVVQWIGDNMQYSLNERHAGVDDPTASFLFGNRTGYCVHTAHASVYLWRLLGIPARVGLGYAVEEADRRGGTLVVMGGDAHAWPELYIQDVGWVPLDVVPAVDLHADERSQVPPDEEELAALGDLAREQPETPRPSPQLGWIVRWALRALAIFLASLAAGALVAHWAAKLWRRAAVLWAPSHALYRVGYRSALDVLTDAGCVREPGETREAFASRLAEVAPSLQALTALHLRGALGTPAPGEAERDRARWTGLLLTLRMDLARSRPRWRRWLGLFDPSTPYRSR